MKKTNLTVTSAFALAALVVITSQSRAADYSDPKQTLLTLCDAIKAKDTKTVHDSFYIDATHKENADIYLGALDASLHFQKAMAAKFGQAGVDAVQGTRGPNAMLEQISKSLDSATVTLNGDAAILQLDDEISAKSPTHGKIQFRKINDQWKIDAASMFNLDDPKLKSALPVLQKIAAATEQTAKDVDSEKLQTVQQAQQTLVQRTIPILKEAREAATQPTAATQQPAK